MPSFFPLSFVLKVIREPSVTASSSSPVKSTFVSHVASPSLNSVSANGSAAAAPSPRPESVSFKIAQPNSKLVKSPVNPLGVRPKASTVASVLSPASVLCDASSNGRLTGGADSASRTPAKVVANLVPYDSDSSDDGAKTERVNVVKKKTDDGLACPLETPAKVPKTSQLHHHHPHPHHQHPVLSTHKANWQVEDDKNLTNRSDTSAESATSSTSGRWKLSAHAGPSEVGSSLHCGYRQPGLLCTPRNFAQSSKFYGKEYFFGAKVTSEAFLSISQNMKVTRLQGCTQTKLRTC